MFDMVRGIMCQIFLNYDTKFVQLYLFSDRLMFWTDHGADPAFIAKANMDGTGFSYIVRQGLVWPNGLAIDTQGILDLFICLFCWVIKRLIQLSLVEEDSGALPFILYQA